ncbi:MAG: hypothetical protein GX478_07165 [Erysipelotrichaceae bacterium]|nr:hypothetical protein [Erysipelotrichaceae bacterium]
MKKQITVLLACMMFCGCSSASGSASASASASPSASAQALDTDAYTAYTASLKDKKTPDSYYAAVNSTYKMDYSDNSNELFVMDGTMEVSGIAANQPSAHTTQHISSKGTESDLSGDYYGGRLYNTYNNVNYYEDMSFNDLKSSLLVPLDAYQIPQTSIASITAEKDQNENVIYTVKLNSDAASSLFSSRYDSYGFSSYDGYQIDDSTITDTFSKDGYFDKEQADFTISVTYKNQAVKVAYSSYVSYLKQDASSVSISDETRTAEAQYVNYKDIDTSSISSESQIDDTAESTVTDTFKKRLVGRLDYTDNGDGTYSDTFNDNESYTIDFNNKTFKYTNYSIAYSYSWKGNTGSMGSCTLVFDSGSASSGCEDSTLTTIKDVKTYLEMELYYCGLSFEDLQAEA